MRRGIRDPLLPLPHFTVKSVRCTEVSDAADITHQFSDRAYPGPQVAFPHCITWLSTPPCNASTCPPVLKDNLSGEQVWKATTDHTPYSTLSSGFMLSFTLHSWLEVIKNGYLGIIIALSAWQVLLFTLPINHSPPSAFFSLLKFSVLFRYPGAKHYTGIWDPPQLLEMNCDWSKPETILASDWLKSGKVA